MPLSISVELDQIGQKSCFSRLRTTMRLAMHTDYALRLLISLGAREGDVVSVTEIADIFGIPRHYLIRVAQRLRDAGYVETVRGNDGGVRLARAPSAIKQYRRPASAGEAPSR